MRGVSRVGLLDMRAQAEVPSALRPDTPSGLLQFAEATEMPELTLLRGSIKRMCTAVPS